jgi:hypothetical protein
MRKVNSPSFNKKTGVVTLPEVQGVAWTVDGEPDRKRINALEPGQTVKVEAVFTHPYHSKGGPTSWEFTRDRSE